MGICVVCLHGKGSLTNLRMVPSLQGLIPAEMGNLTELNKMYVSIYLLSCQFMLYCVC